MTAFVKPKIYYNNALRIAQEGNDGTAYATCAEALADAADAFKVRGSVRLASDVAALSDLVGGQVKFDDTENLYKITGAASNPYGAALDTIISPYAENNHGQMAQAGSYVYTVVNKTVMKLDATVSPPTIAFRCPLPTSEQYAFTLICSDGTYLYVASGLTTTLYVIRISTMAVEWSGTPPSFSGTGFSAIACDSNNLFLASAGSSAAIYKYSIGLDPQYLGSVSASGYGSTPTVNSLYTGTDDGYLYAAGSAKTASPTPVWHMIYRIDRSTLAMTGAVDATGTVSDSGYGLVHYGSYIYSSFTRGGLGYASKMDVSGFPGTVTELALSAGELPVAGVDTDGTSLFYYCNTSPAQLVKVSIAAFTRTSGLTLSAGENGTTGYGNILYDGAALLVGCTTSPAILVAATTAMERTGALTYYKGLTEAGEAAVVSGQYAYIGYAHSPSRIAKYDLFSGEIVCQLELNTGENSVTSLVIAQDGYLYAGCGVTPGIVVKIDIATSVTAMTRTGATAAFAAGEGPINALDASDGKIYAGCGSTPGKIKKINATDLALDAVLTFTAGRNDIRAFEIIGTDIYAGCYTNHLVKSSLSSFTETGAVDCGNPVLETAQDASYIYVIMSATSNNIRRVAISGFSLGAALSTGAASTPAACIVLGTELHVHHGTTKFDIVDLPTWEIIQTITSAALDAVAQNFRRMLSYGYYIWLLNEGGSGEYAYSSLIQVDSYQSLSLYERLQDADIGGAFSVRAGLTCAQAAAIRPVSLIADNHLDPRFTGLDSAGFSIRIHAPNFIDDGGFESGGLTNWTAGANWAIDSATELEGLYSAKWNGAANNNLSQARTGKLKAGKTYILLYKAQALTAPTLVDVLTVSLTAATSGTALDADLDGTSPIITSAAPLWVSHEFVPDFDTNAWTLTFTPALAKLDSATAVIIDEVYVYEKMTINSLIVGKHNWNSKGTITVNAWRLSPLRSTAAANAALDKVEIGSFAVDSTDTISQALTASTYPVFEIVSSGAAGWIPEAGEAYLGDYKEFDFPPDAPFDPWEIGQDGLRRVKLRFQYFPYAERATWIRDVFKKASENETLWWKWQDDPPLLTESDQKQYSAPYNSTMVDFNLDLIEKM